MMSTGAAGPPDHGHEIVHDDRPWGWFRRYTHNDVSTVKIIEIAPGESLSLQRHRDRDELWVVLDDGLRVTIGQQTTLASRGEEFFVPRGTVHRVTGADTAPARFMEVAFGDFDEHDIERIEDDYGRT